MGKKYIIGIVSPYELEDRRASSGTMYMLLNAIKHQGFCIKKISVDYSYKRSFENRIKKRLYQCFKDFGQQRFEDYFKRAVAKSEFHHHR